jgi:hypothetical protein
VTQPRLVTPLPVFERDAEGRIRRTTAGGPVALWAVPGIDRPFRTRKAAKRAAARR